MKNLKQIERLRQVHELVKINNTGDPGTLAARLHISERQLYNCLEHLKELDAPLYYDRKHKTYYYSEPFDLLVNVSVQVMVHDELRSIYAGFVPLQHGFRQHLLTDDLKV